ncbi:hypothetical protein Ancab_008737, partial [Ancistrocladus abbreviatus]
NRIPKSYIKILRSARDIKQSRKPRPWKPELHLINLLQINNENHKTQTFASQLQGEGEIYPERRHNTRLIVLKVLETIYDQTVESQTSWRTNYEQLEFGPRRIAKTAERFVKG